MLPPWCEMKLEMPETRPFWSGQVTNSVAVSDMGAFLRGLQLVQTEGCRALPGWASIVLPMYFLGGVQLLATGIIGEYLARIYIETKARPRFIVEQIIGESPASSRETALAAATDPTPAR